MTTYTATNVVKISKRKTRSSEEERTEKNRKNWKTQHYAKRLSKRLSQDNELN